MGMPAKTVERWTIRAEALCGVRWTSLELPEGKFSIPCR